GAGAEADPEERVVDAAVRQAQPAVAARDPARFHEIDAARGDHVHDAREILRRDLAVAAHETDILAGGGAHAGDDPAAVPAVHRHRDDLHARVHGCEARA